MSAIRHERTLADSQVNAQIYQLGAAATRHLGGPAADHNGGYLESYLSLPGLTRASAAVTCNRTAFTQ
jgi:hypothetical protein